MKTIIFKAFKTLFFVTTAALAVVASLIVLSILNVHSEYKLYTVSSGSMEPSIKTGSIVIDKTQTDYGIGDVITFTDIDKPKVPITHRIVEIKSMDGQTFYSTKGDKNNSNDFTLTNKNNVIGKVIFSIPYIGYPVSFGKTQTGFTLFVIIPATILVYSEIQNIIKEIKTLKNKRKEVHEKKKETVPETDPIK